MKNNNLEDQLKDAFGNFEPEVDPSLWTKISSQLPATPSPVQPVAEPSGVLSTLSSAGTWIAGAAAVIVAGAGIYLVLNSEPDAVTEKSNSSTPIVTPEAPGSDESVANPDKEPAQPDFSEVSDVKTSGEVHDQPVKTESATTLNNTHSAESIVQEPSASKSTTSQAAPVTAPKPDIQHVTSSPGAPTDRAQSETAVPLRLIVTANGGFAPLSITVLSNQPGKKSDFDFGDGYTSHGESASHIYKEAGYFTASCVLDNQQAEQSIEVLEALPTAFSPNGDGTNDAFIIDNADLREIEIRIYQRNGRQVFSGKGSTVSWNGLYSDGRPAETGTYFYDIFATSLRGNVYKQKGTLTLFR